MDFPDYSTLPGGYKNPLDSSTSPIGSDYDWGSFSRGIDWNQTPAVATGRLNDAFQEAPTKSRWGEALQKATDYLNSQKRSNLDEARRRSQSMPGAQDLGGGISVVYPQVVQSAPQQSMLSKITGAAAPFAAMIPGAGPFLAAGLGAASRLS